jgi:hypothetical protein
VDKRQFIQLAFLYTRPKREQFEMALAWARDAWAYLDAQGLGGPKKDEPKPHGRVDWYARLDDAQRAGFDRFWKDYDHKHGKADAAMVWAQINPDAETLEWICLAARTEAANWRNDPPHGQSRIYPQGWLSAYRWQDHPRPGAPKGVNGPSKDTQRANQINELRGLETLYAASKHPALKVQIDALKEKLNVPAN